MANQAMTRMDFVRAAKAEIAEVDGARVEAMRKERPNLMLLDVRKASEYVQGHFHALTGDLPENFAGNRALQSTDKKTGTRRRSMRETPLATGQPP